MARCRRHQCVVVVIIALHACDMGCLQERLLLRSGLDSNRAGPSKADVSARGREYGAWVIRES